MEPYKRNLLLIVFQLALKEMRNKDLSEDEKKELENILKELDMSEAQAIEEAKEILINY